MHQPYLTPEIPKTAKMEKLKTEDEKLKILLIEDDPGDVDFLQELLFVEKRVSFRAIAARLHEGIVCLATGDIDIVLLDINLPDSQGLDTFLKIHAHSPCTPVIVLTGNEDDALAMEAVKLGAQDYLIKREVDSRLLVRAIRYAVERHRLLSQLERARQLQQQEHESRSLERITASPPAAITAQSFGLKSLQESDGEVFRNLVQRYGHLLDMALEQRSYRVEQGLSEALRSLVDRLGAQTLGPRDVVEIHTSAIKGKGKMTTHQKAAAYMEEGRILLLELMGGLVSYYRNFALGFWKPSVDESLRGDENLEPINKVGS